MLFRTPLGDSRLHKIFVFLLGLFPGGKNVRTVVAPLSKSFATHRVGSIARHPSDVPAGVPTPMLVGHLVP